MGKKMGIVALITLLSLNFAWAGELKAPLAGNSAQLLGFAGHLYETGEYYRAITEYQRFIFLYPQDEKVPYARFQVGACYFAGEQWEDAVKVWQPLSEQSVPDQLRRQVLYYLGAAYYKLQKYTLCRKYVRQLEEEYPQCPLRQEGHKLAVMSYMEEERWAEAAQEVRQSQLPGAQELSVGIAGGDKLPYKSPGLAGTLSAILPGAGQVYAKRSQDGIMAFMLNGLFIWGMVEAFNHDKTATGVILLFFESGWYLGNIYSAVNSAHKYNRKLDKNFREEMESNIQFNLGAPQAGPLGLNVSYRF